MVRALVPAVLVAFVVVAATYGLVGTAAADDVTLEITVVDRDGRPASDADIRVTWNDSQGGPVERTTTADGRALVDVPDGANVAIEVVDDEYVRNRAFRIFDVEGGQVTVPASESGRATFVVEGADGPVADATLSVRAPGGEVDSLTTNASGVARTRPLEQGRYTVRVTAPRHSQRDVSIELTSVEKTETITVRRADVDATITVVDDHFEPPRPIEDASVGIESLPTTQTTGSDGTVSVSVPVNADHRVRVSKDGYDAERVTLRVDEESVEREVAIQREPSLSLVSVNRRVVVGESTVVTVTDEYDQRVEGVTVSVEGETVGTTDAQGQIQVPIDTQGNVTVEASDSGTTASIPVEGVDPSATEAPTGTPAPTNQSSAATATPTGTPGGDGSGFGAVVAVLAVLAAGLLARDR